MLAKITFASEPQIREIPEDRFMHLCPPRLFPYYSQQLSGKIRKWIDEQMQEHAKTEAAWQISAQSTFYCMRKGAEIGD